MATSPTGKLAHSHWARARRMLSYHRQRPVIHILTSGGCRFMYRVQCSSSIQSHSSNLIYHNTSTCDHLALAALFVHGPASSVGPFCCPLNAQHTARRPPAHIALPMTDQPSACGTLPAYPSIRRGCVRDSGSLRSPA